MVALTLARPGPTSVQIPSSSILACYSKNSFFSGKEAAKGEVDQIFVTVSEEFLASVMVYRGSSGVDAPLLALLFVTSRQKKEQETDNSGENESVVSLAVLQRIPQDMTLGVIAVHLLML